MQVIRDTRRLKGKIKPSIITLGNFDGVHLGHQRILKGVKERAMELGCPSLVYTFEPHPLKVVAPHRSPAIITPLEEKIRLIAQFGIDYLLCANFTKGFAGLHPRRFVQEELVDRLVTREVWVGHDYAFGRAKQGTVGYLKRLGKELGFGVHIIPAYKRGGEVVSSSRVRRLIHQGRVKEVTTLLNRHYGIIGVVVKGRRRGEGLGFPTANVIPVNNLLPKNGVYAVLVTVGERNYQGVANIGISPTFGGDSFTVEAHIIDFEGKIYGKKIRIEFVERIRDERCFDGTQPLIEEIKRDVERARRILGRI